MRGDPMRLATIDPATIRHPLAFGQMNRTKRTGDHFLRGRITPSRCMVITRRSTFHPHPPDHTQQCKQNQVFHRVPRNKKSPRKIRKPQWIWVKTSALESISSTLKRRFRPSIYVVHQHNHQSAIRPQDIKQDTQRIYHIYLASIAAAGKVKSQFH